MPVKPVLTALLAGSLFAASSASAAVIDFSRNGGEDFTNGTAVVDAPVDPAAPTRRIFLVGTAGRTAANIPIPGELVFERFTSGEFKYGVDSDAANPSTDSGIGGQDLLEFRFNFDGVLDGVDLSSLGTDARPFIIKNFERDGTSSAARSLVQDSFYTEQNKPQNSIRIDSLTDSITGLGDIDEQFFTFSAGETFTFTSTNFRNYGLQTLTVLVPTPGAGAALLGVAGLLCMVRRREA